MTKVDDKETNKKDISLIILYILLVISIILLIYTAFVIVASSLNHKDYKLENYNKSDYIQMREKVLYEYENFDRSKCLKTNEAEQLIKNILNIKVYIIIRNNVGVYGANGITYLIPRMIAIDDDLKGSNYLSTLTHELIHLTYMTRNETFTQFMTFKTLYESNNEYIHFLGLEFALQVFNGYFTREYNCVGNIVNYLNKK